MKLFATESNRFKFAAECLLIVGAMILAPFCYGWEVSTHRSMGRGSLTNSVRFASARPEIACYTNVLLNPVYWQLLEDYLEFEDLENNALEHF